MKAPKIMCDNVRQFAVSVFSTEPMSLIASVDIGTAAFLTVTGFSGVDGGREAPRSGAINHGPVKKSIPRYGRSVSLERPALPRRLPSEEKRQSSDEKDANCHHQNLSGAEKLDGLQGHLPSAPDLPRC